MTGEHVDRPTGIVLPVVSAVEVVHEEGTGTRYARVAVLPDGPRLTVEEAG